jgi:hypothetical protein
MSSPAAQFQFMSRLPSQNEWLAEQAVEKLEQTVVRF